MDIAISTWRTRIGVACPLLTASLGFIGILLAVETPGTPAVVQISLVVGLISAALLSIHLSRRVALVMVITYALLVGIASGVPFLFGWLRLHYEWELRHDHWIVPVFDLERRLVLQGAPLIAGLTLGFMLRILAGKWSKLTRLVGTEARNPQTIAAVRAAVLIAPTLVSLEGMTLWFKWVEIFQGIANHQLTRTLEAWVSLAIILALVAIGMVARARGRSSRAFWNRLVVVFAIAFVPAYARIILVDVARIAADAPIGWITLPLIFAVLLLLIFSEAACALLIGAWIMALVRRR